MDIQGPEPELAIEILRGEDTTQAHILGLFNRDDVLVHLHVAPDLDGDTHDSGDYWATLSGRNLAEFVTLHCPGCWADHTQIALRYAVHGGRFLGWR